MNYARVRTNPTLLALAIAGIVAGNAQAQTQTDGIQEVIVTAQRQAAPESKTPVAMSVLGGEQLEKAGLDTPADIGARLPNTYLQGSYDGLRITIRGISSADNTEKGDPSAAFMVDGIYVARPQSQNISFYDIDRVEVLRGPQGTLYGRNTTAGVVNVISKAPVWQREGAISATVGSYATHKVSAMFNQPVNDMLALRAALTWNEHDSYLKNGPGVTRKLGLDRDDRAARLSARLKFGQDADLLVRYENSRDDTNNDSAVADANFYSGIGSGHPVWNGDSSERVRTNRFVPFNAPTEQGYSHKKTSSLSARAELEPRSGHPVLARRPPRLRTPVPVQLLLPRRAHRCPRRAPALRRRLPAGFAGAARRHPRRRSAAGPGRRVLVPRNGERSVQLPRPAAGRPAALLRVRQRPGEVAQQGAVRPGHATASPPACAPPPACVSPTTTSRASAPSATSARPPTTPATDLRELNAGTIASNKTTWRLGLDYDLNPSTLVYGALATGYKSGGFNDGCSAGTSVGGIGCPAASAVPQDSLVYQPETVRAFELGAKTRFWNKRASLNLAAFHYDYKNLQLSAETVVNGKPRYETVNAGEASVRGLEADGQLLLTAADRFTWALTLLDAHYTRYSPNGVVSWAGVKLDRSPARTLALGYEHRLRLSGGSLVGAIGTRASASYLISVPSQQLQFRVPGHSESDLRLGWEPDGGRWGLTARVRNIEDKVRPLTIGGSGLTVPSDPRTADLRFDYRFF
jgi:iron complex outermembrane receptor protein